MSRFWLNNKSLLQFVTPLKGDNNPPARLRSDLISLTSYRVL